MKVGTVVSVTEVAGCFGAQGEYSQWVSLSEIMNFKIPQWFVEFLLISTNNFKNSWEIK